MNYYVSNGSIRITLICYQTNGNLKHHQTDQHEHQHEGEQHDCPGKILVSVLAQAVQNDCPYYNVYHLCEEHKKVRE